MNFYISKLKSKSKDNSIELGIQKIYTDATIVDTIEKANIIVFQKGWTHSKKCLSDYYFAKEHKIKIQEGYIYTDKYSPHLN